MYVQNTVCFENSTYSSQAVVQWWIPQDVAEPNTFGHMAVDQMSDATARDCNRAVKPGAVHAVAVTVPLGSSM